MFTPSNTHNSNNPPYPYSSSSSSFCSYPLLHHPFLANLPDAINNASSSANTTFHLHDPLPLPFIHPPIPETLPNLPSDYAPPVCPKQDNTAFSHYGIPSNFLSKKLPPPASKKDRHSKIYTSQGLRDRRVRLSIDIARKFFDLQDMLGFDKASTTLDWLFSKSKKAIKQLELASHCKYSNITNGGGGSSSSSEAPDEEVVSHRADSDRKSRRAEKEKDKAKKESREKARARARERTSHKMCTATAAAATATTATTAAATGKGKSLVVVGNDGDIIEERGRDQEFKVIEESIVIKRKLKQPSNLMVMQMPSHPQNQLLDIPNKELPSFSNANTTTTATATATTADYSSIFPNLSPNWDTNASIHGRSNICAFASMNLSTELQIFGKTWEECNNQRLH